jgi:hypothetical protein
MITEAAHIDRSLSNAENGNTKSVRQRPVYPIIFLKGMINIAAFMRRYL